MSNQHKLHTDKCVHMLTCTHWIIMCRWLWYYSFIHMVSDHYRFVYLGFCRIVALCIGLWIGSKNVIWEGKSLAKHTLILNQYQLYLMFILPLDWVLGIQTIIWTYLPVASIFAIQCIPYVVCTVTFDASHYGWLSSPTAQLCTVTGNVTNNAETTGRPGLINKDKDGYINSYILSCVLK